MNNTKNNDHDGVMNEEYNLAAYNSLIVKKEDVGKQKWVVHSLGEFLESVGRSPKWGKLENAIIFPTKEVTQHFLNMVVLAGPPDSYNPMHINEALCVEVLGA